MIKKLELYTPLNEGSLKVMFALFNAFDNINLEPAWLDSHKLQPVPGRLGH